MKNVEVRFKKSANALVVKIVGEIDVAGAQELRRKIDVEYDLGAVRDIVFDLTDVGFMDSSGIGMIIGRYKRAASIGGRIKAFGANKNIKRIMELSGLGSIVEEYNSEQEAVEGRRR